ACYIEAIPKVSAFFSAVRKARQNGKTVVVTKIGGSEKSRRAALAHTGSLSGSLQAFDVFAREEGIIRAETIEDLVESCIFLSRAPRPRGRNIGLITNSGALKALATEAGEALNVSFAELSPTSGGTITAAVPDLEVSNPLDTKRTLSTEQYLATVEAVHDDPAVDMVLIAEELPRAAGIDRKVSNFRALDAYIETKASKPIVCFSPVTCADNQYMASLRRELPRIAWLRDLNKTLRVASRLAPANDPPLVAPHLHASDVLRQSLMSMAATHTEAFALNEQLSKKILGEFGIHTAREAFVEGMDVEEVARAAREIGFPVVLKVVSAAVTHKSDRGLVLLNLPNEPDLRQAVQLLSQRCDALGVCAEGLLVAQQITGGVEVVIGLHRDPEMGPVVMFGSGGTLLELLCDVAFGPPGLDDTRGRNMILSTRVADLIKGYRGSEGGDLEA